MLENKQIEAFYKKIGFKIPNEIVSFLEENKSKEFYGEEINFIPWSLERIITSNLKYKEAEILPSKFIIIGSDGGGEAFAIERGTLSIFQLPFIPMEEKYAILRAKTFNEFLNWIKK